MDTAWPIHEKSLEIRLGYPHTKSIDTHWRRAIFRYAVCQIFFSILRYPLASLSEYPKPNRS